MEIQMEGAMDYFQGPMAKKVWGKGHCCLIDGEILIYAKKRDKIPMFTVGGLAVSNIEVKEDVKLSSRTKFKYFIEIQTRAKTWIFSCKTPEEREDWVSAVTSHRERAKTSPQVPCHIQYDTNSSRNSLSNLSVQDLPDRRTSNSRAFHHEVSEKLESGSPCSSRSLPHTPTAGTPNRAPIKLPEPKTKTSSNPVIINEYSDLKDESTSTAPASRRQDALPSVPTLAKKSLTAHRTSSAPIPAINVPIPPAQSLEYVDVRNVQKTGNISNSARILPPLNLPKEEPADGGLEYADVSNVGSLLNSNVATFNAVSDDNDNEVEVNYADIRTISSPAKTRSVIATSTAKSRPNSTIGLPSTARRPLPGISSPSTLPTPTVKSSTKESPIEYAMPEKQSPLEYAMPEKEKESPIEYAMPANDNTISGRRLPPVRTSDASSFRRSLIQVPLENDGIEYADIINTAESLSTSTSRPLPSVLTPSTTPVPEDNGIEYADLLDTKAALSPSSSAARPLPTVQPTEDEDCALEYADLSTPASTPEAQRVLPDTSLGNTRRALPETIPGGRALPETIPGGRGRALPETIPGGRALPETRASAKNRETKSVTVETFTCDDEYTDPNTSSGLEYAAPEPEVKSTSIEIEYSDVVNQGNFGTSSKEDSMPDGGLEYADLVTPVKSSSTPVITPGAGLTTGFMKPPVTKVEPISLAERKRMAAAKAAVGAPNRNTYSSGGRGLPVVTNSRSPKSSRPTTTGRPLPATLPNSSGRSLPPTSAVTPNSRSLPPTTSTTNSSGRSLPPTTGGRQLPTPVPSAGGRSLPSPVGSPSAARGGRSLPPVTGGRSTPTLPSRH